MRTTIYVDGFNLYHAIKNTNYKWLNLVELAIQVLPPQCEVTKLRYFTALVTPIDMVKRQGKKILSFARRRTKLRRSCAMRRAACATFAKSTFATHSLLSS